MFRRSSNDATWHAYFHRVLRDACVRSAPLHSAPIITATVDANRAPRPLRYTVKTDEIVIRSDLLNGFADSMERLLGTETIERELLVMALSVGRWRLHAVGGTPTLRDPTSIAIGTDPIPLALKRVIKTDEMLLDIMATTPLNIRHLAIDSRVTALMATFYLWELNDPAIADRCLTT